MKILWNEEDVRKPFRLEVATTEDAIKLGAMAYMAKTQAKRNNAKLLITIIKALASKEGATATYNKLEELERIL